MSVEKYLAQYAEPEAEFARELAASKFSRAFVLPLRDEPVRAWEWPEDALVIVVVNGIEPSRLNARMLEALRDQPGVLVCDRATEGRLFGPDDGVGKARKIGFDIALALWVAGSIASPFVRSIDADADLDLSDGQDPGPDVVATTHDFWHEGDEATGLYELWLRHYVAGLAAAGSPWAWSAIGSCISVRADAYAAVRGFPCRVAGEDFHLLAKVAKLGAVERSSAGAVQLSGRRSRRVPFGTGRGIARIDERLANGEPVTLHHPAAFANLREQLRAIARFADTEDPRDLAPELRGRVLAACKSARSPEQRWRRAHEALDALQTLRLVHRGPAPIPWRDALALWGWDLPDDSDGLRRALAERAPRRCCVDYLRPNGAATSSTINAAP